MTLDQRVVVVGASGFGRESLDVLEAMRNAGGNLEISGVVDDAPSRLNLERLAARSIPYIGTIDDWLREGGSARNFVLGVGNPKLRLKLTEKLIPAGRIPFTAIHPSASIGSRVSLGEGVVTCPGAVVSTNVQLGRQVHINPNATLGHDSVLEDFVSVNPGAVISGEVHIRRGVLIGAAATILQGLTIGSWTTIGAGAVVTKDVPAHVVVIGVPGVWK